jgi:hypothetical protein
MMNKFSNHLINGGLYKQVWGTGEIMKLLFVAALAVGTLPFTLAAAPAVAQQISSVPELTCRGALEGSEFFEIKPEEAPTCCYITEELAWYQENDVFLNRFYEKDGPAVYYTVDQCRLDLDGTGIVASGPGIDDTTTGSIPDGPDAVVDDPLAANPGNRKPVGGAGETPSDGDFGALPPGEKGKSDN